MAYRLQKIDDNSAQLKFRLEVTGSPIEPNKFSTGKKVDPKMEEARDRMIEAQRIKQGYSLSRQQLGVQGVYRKPEDIYNYYRYNH